MMVKFQILKKLTEKKQKTVTLMQKSSWECFFSGTINLENKFRLQCNILMKLLLRIMKRRG